LQALLGDPERRGPIPRRRASAPTTTTAAPVTYTVMQGDTLTDIAKQFHTSVSAVVATNRLTDPDHLTEGQELVMPPPSAVRIDAELVDKGAAPAIGLTLVGAEPAELVTFVVMLPDGSTYTGAPHTASAQGTVATTYTTALVSGTFVVTATGERGTNAQVAFHVDPPG
jgi:LysM repeat protein